MNKNIFWFRLFFALCAFIFSNFSHSLYRGSESKTLSNGIELICFETTRTDDVYIVLAISTGTNDSPKIPEITELAGRIFAKNLRTKLNADDSTYVTETSYHVGNDQTLFVMCGNRNNLSKYIEILDSCIADFYFNESDLIQEKSQLIQIANQQLKDDKARLRAKAHLALYARSCSQNFDAGRIDEITSDQIKNFVNIYYLNDKKHLMVSCNTSRKNKNDIENSLSKKFIFKKTDCSKQIIKEQYLCYKTAKIVSVKSSQVKLPFVEIYWKAPSYNDNFSTSLHLDLFAKYLNHELNRSLANKNLTSFVKIENNHWNANSGEIKFAFIFKNPNESEIEKTIEIIVDEIRKITDNSSSSNWLKSAIKELKQETAVFNYKMEIIDTMIWTANRISSGYKLDTLKNFHQSISETKKEDAELTAREFFKKNPDVISILKPVGE